MTPNKVKKFKSYSAGLLSYADDSVDKKPIKQNFGDKFDQTIVDSVGNNDDVHHLGVSKISHDDNSWGEVICRKKESLNVNLNPWLEKSKGIRIGKASNNTELVVNVSGGKRAIFVTRFQPSVTSKDIEYLLVNLNLKHVKCTQLRTKFCSYSSFHIEVVASEFYSVNNPDVWPDGILISLFYGQLKA